MTNITIYNTSKSSNIEISGNNGIEDITKTIYTEENESFNTNNEMMLTIEVANPRYCFQKITHYPDDFFAEEEILENDSEGTPIEDSQNVTIKVPIDKQSPTWFYKCFLKLTSERNSFSYIENLTNCTSSMNGKKTISKDEIITFTADEGYKFVSNGKCVIDRSPYLDYEFDFTPTNEKQFSLDISNTTTINGNVEITLIADKEQTTTISNFTNLYLTNSVELGSLSLERFIVSTDNNNYEYYDYGSNILNLIKIPFSVDELINRKSNIKLGKYESKTESTLLSDYILNVDIGTIKVPYKYNDFRDFTNTKTKLYLPYIESIELDNEYVIDKEINITYRIDLYSGQVNVILKNENTFLTKTTTISQEIPFIQLPSGSTNNTIKILLDNDIRNAYIEVIRNEVIINEFGSTTNETGQLSNYHGYTEIDKTILYTKAPYNEQNEIKQLLQQGVILP